MLPPTYADPASSAYRRLASGDAGRGVACTQREIRLPQSRRRPRLCPRKGLKRGQEMFSDIPSLLGNRALAKGEQAVLQIHCGPLSEIGRAHV